MKIFGYQSGHAAFASPVYVPTERQTYPERSAETLERREEAAAPARAATQHCRFYCKWCESPILMPHDKLGLPFAGPFLRKMEARSVATVCSACNHVGGFSLFRGAYGYDTRNNLVTEPPVGQTVLLDWLKCEEPTCSFPLPLFVTAEEKLTGERAKELAGSWLWGELTCTSGHRIKAPLWVFNRTPYEMPAQIK